MKKNRMMRLASVLLVAVLMTTCTISGTFAKYVTSDNASDTARVAKWGVKVNPNGQMFFVDYDAKDGGAQVLDTDVVYSNTSKVVAPGTDGAMTDITFEGAPEVAYKITYNSTLTLTGWEVGSPATYYCPLVITVDGTPINGMDYASANEFAAAVKKAIDDLSAEYNANTALSGANVPNVSWAWPFADATGSKYDQDNAKDTALGDLAAAGSAPEITLAITTTVEQIEAFTP